MNGHRNIFTPSNGVFRGPPRISTPKGTTIRSATFWRHRHVTDWQTHHAMRSSVAIALIPCIRYRLITSSQSDLTKTAPNDPACTARAIHCTRRRRHWLELRDRQTDRQTDTANIGENRQHLINLMQPKKETDNEEDHPQLGRTTSRDGQGSWPDEAVWAPPNPPKPRTRKKVIVKARLGYSEWV